MRVSKNYTTTKKEMGITKFVNNNFKSNVFDRLKCKVNQPKKTSQK